MATTNFEEVSVAELQRQMESGSLTSEALITYYLNRIRDLDQSGPELNAVIELNPDAIEIARALDAERKTKGSRGPLHGIPVLLKANIDTGDQMTTTAGSIALRGHKARQDAFFVKSLREAGAVLLGKTNLSEWANFRSTRSTSGWSSEGGQTKNPYVLDRSPCGSSSGSGVAVAANLTVLAVGTETDGSVVCPSGVNGIVGIKPTLGLVSRHGIIPIAHSQDTAGPMARTVADAALLLNAMVAKDEDDPASSAFPASQPDYTEGLTDGVGNITVGVWRTYFGVDSNPLVEEQFEQAIAVLKKEAASIVDPVDLGDLAELDDAEYEVLLYEFKTDLRTYLESHGSPQGMSGLDDLIDFNEQNRAEAMPRFGQEIFLQAEKKGSLGDEAYLDALKKSKTLAQEAIDVAMKKQGVDVLIAPTNAPAWTRDWLNGDHYTLSSSTLAAVSGYPSVTLPMGMAGELPVGISLIGPAHSEPMLLRVAQVLEDALNARAKPKYIPSVD
ncbi:MAG: amidase [Candidatus Eisenbacteria bacterium]|uniref:Amidase n=1 Tax=Eiseniibacteriota bacterium TaxID=2212470 RepID=A0A7Y2EBS6_UNCEI|nr:amidase [Candidatus Eisenbacteria bacterium]